MRSAGRGAARFSSCSALGALSRWRVVPTGDRYVKSESTLLHFSKARLARAMWRLRTGEASDFNYYVISSFRVIRLDHHLPDML